MDNFEIQQIKVEDSEEVLQFMRQHYYLEEPLTEGLEPRDQHDNEDEEFNMSNIQHGTCLKLMIDDQIIALVLASPKSANEADKLFAEADHLANKKWSRILRILATVERSANVFEKYKVTKVLHAHVLSVDVNKRGQNLGSLLVTALVELAKDLKYELVTMDCTSVYSARICERLGWECVSTLLYKNYKNESRRFANKSQIPSDIEISIIPKDYNKHVVEFLRLHYYKEEPLTVGLEPKDHHDIEDEEFNVANLKHGTSLMAKHKSVADKIVGVVLAGPKGPKEASYLFECARQAGPTKWGHTLQLIACIERDTDIFKRYNVKNVLHIHALSVDKEMRGKNLGTLLMTELVKLATCQKYEVITVDCTSYYSAKICERLGWDIVNTLYYKDYKDENDVQIFRPDMPHDSVKTYAFRLQKEEETKKK